VAEQLALHEQYAEPAQQRGADFFGMYLFLASEMMLFGGFFAVVYVQRLRHPEAVRAAAQHLKLWLGGINTAVLLTSSLFVALAVVAARTGARHSVVRRLLIAALLGVVFIGIKGFEYYEEYTEGLMPLVGPPSPLSEPASRLFINLYFFGTGVHAVHLTIGLALLLGLALRVARRATPLPQRAITVVMVGLYWHLVDVVWVFIYPVLYLARG
jgi:cytochrome c oxidase subunit III